MKRIEKAIVLNAPLGNVCECLSRVEEFPGFMPGVQSVHRLDGCQFHWRVSVWGRTIDWVAETQAAAPEPTFAWRSVAGRTLSGVVAFKRIGDDKTFVTVTVDYDVEGPVEWICDELLGVVSFHVATGLLRFRESVEGCAGFPRPAVAAEPSPA